MKKSISVFLTILISITPILLLLTETAAFADDSTVSISTADELISFSKKCSSDSYSEKMTVELKNDIDLKNTEFVNIPYFSGAFNGNGHTIKNFKLTSDGSHQGFFRYVSEKAFVSDLHISGTVKPGGTGCVVGGVASVNNGVITNCSFSGDVAGIQTVGGIVGNNTGTVSDCVFEGEVTGEHQAGGIAGENSGIVSECENKGSINTIPISTASSSTPIITNFTLDRTFDISEISEDDFLDITDIGGIAGYSEGIIENCTNSEKVGYDRTGYNIGGIVGRESGYIDGCNNKADVLGRKDVGGIVGQLEPFTKWDFSESKLTELKKQLNELNKDIEKISNDIDSSSADSSAKQLSDNLNTIQGYIQQTTDDTQTLINQTSDNLQKIDSSAKEITQLLSDSIEEHNHEKTKELIVELKELIQNGDIIFNLSDLLSIQKQIIDEEKTHFKDEHFYSELDLIGEMKEIIENNSVTPPDSGAIFNDVQNIISSVQDAKNNINDIKGDLKGKRDVLKQDIKAFENQLDNVYATFFTTAENLTEINKDVQADVSLDNTTSDTAGIVKGCKNYAEVNAETNAGGVVGSVSFEISFDAEDKLNVSDYLLNDAKYLIFALIKDSESYNNITAKKSCAGGIAGNMDFGAVYKCVGAGTINVSNGDYSGGIAGQSKGNIKDCCSRSLISGSKYIGGIVGDGENVDGCKSYSFILDGKEYFGTIAGNINGSIENCLFVKNDIGAVDGISYKGNAEPIAYSEMLEIDGIPDVFKKIVVTFVADKETVDEIEVAFGGSIDKLPQVPMKGVKYWKWDDFDNEHIYYSMTINGKYCEPKTTIATNEDVPKFLAEGNFYEGQKLTVKDFKPESYDSEIIAENIICSGTLNVNEFSGILKIRMKAPDKGTLYIIGKDGQYTKTKYEADGSYIVFEAENGSSIVYVKAATDNRVIYLSAAICGIVIIIAAIILIIKKRSKSKKTSVKKAKESVNTDSTEK